MSGETKGVQDKRDYLNELGIKFIWFNPISESPDNHGYSVNNYTSINPYFGSIESRDSGIVINNANESLRIFDEMVSSLGELGIKVFYDAVINHCSAQSVYFQRFDTSISPFEVSDAYPAVDGAYESTGSPYYDWFQFSTWNHDYDSWWGFDNIPTMIYESAGGEIDVVALALRSVILELYQRKDKSPFIADEPFKFVSPEYMTNAGMFIQTLNEKMGRQILIVTHKEELAGFADNLIEIEKLKGE